MRWKRSRPADRCGLFRVSPTTHGHRRPGQRSWPAPEVAERLFEPFSTGKPEGIGLGLAVARQIAEAHGGSLDFSSAGGTCFTVRLPLQAAQRRLSKWAGKASPPPKKSI